MKLGVLALTGGALALAGCAPSAGGTAKPTSQPTLPPSIAITATSVAAADPTLTPLPVHASGSAYHQGSQYLHARRWSQAIAAFRSAIKNGQNVAGSYSGMGAAEASQGNWANSLHDYTKASSAAPHNPRYVYAAAYSALEAQQYNVAVQWATRYTQLEPKSAAGYHLRFLAYGSLLHAKSQLSDARTIVGLRPHDPQSWNDMGIAEANNKHMAVAATDFTKAIRLDPNVYSFYTNRALAENQLHEPSKVLHDFELARKHTKDPAAIQQIDAAIAQLKKQKH